MSLCTTNWWITCLVSWVFGDLLKYLPFAASVLIQNVISLLISSWDERSFPIYPLTPKSDWQVTSPYHTHELLSKKVRINNQILGVKELSDSLLVWTYFCVIPVASSCFYLHILFYKDQVRDLISKYHGYLHTRNKSNHSALTKGLCSKR